MCFVGANFEVALEIQLTLCWCCLEFLLIVLLALLQGL